MPVEIQSMSSELQFLVWAVALAFGQLLIAMFGSVQQIGMSTAVGNRDKIPEITGWAGRARRAHSNMLESLVLFAALVLVAKAMDLSNGNTILGAQLFFWGRLAFALIYLFGIVWLRTAAWMISVFGLLLIFFELI